MARATANPNRAASLLLKAIRQLPEREQDVVFRHLIASGIGAGTGAPGAYQEAPFRIAGHAPPWPPVPAGVEIRGSQSQFAPGGAQVVPVRLPEAQYRRLKEWCQGHNFAMAVVIRGLVDQFLDRQGGSPSGRMRQEG